MTNDAQGEAPHCGGSSGIGLPGAGGGALLGALSIPPISQQLPEQANGAMIFVFTSQ
jgi:hypothetical protein